MTLQAPVPQSPAAPFAIPADAVALLVALAEPTRLGALRLLRDGGEHCLCELMAALGASQSRMSRHMAALKAAALVADRRDAQWVRYRMRADLAPQARALIDAALALAAAPRREGGAP
jgi:ArsR family transcriptional regulator